MFYNNKIIIIVNIIISRTWGWMRKRMTEVEEETMWRNFTEEKDKN